MIGRMPDAPQAGRLHHKLRQLWRCTKEPVMEGRLSRATLRAEYRRRVFQVFNGDKWMCSYGDLYFMQPEAASPTRD